MALFDRWHPWIVLIVTALLYVPSLSGNWVWDDFHIIQKNPAITDPIALVKNDMWGPSGYDSPTSVPYYRPLSMLTYVPGQALWGGPLPERVINLALHLLVTGLLASLAQALGANRRAAWFGAACFAWLPAASETVAWVSARGDLLGAAFLLGGLLAQKRSRPGLAGALFFAAPFCKDSYIVVSLCVMIWLWANRVRPDRSLVLAVVGAGVYLGVRMLVGLPIEARHANFDPVHLLGAIGAFAARGIQLLADWRSPDVLEYYDGWPLLGVSAILAVAFALARVRGRPWLGLLLVALPITAISILPTLQFGIVGDRYYYALFACAAVAAALGFDALQMRIRARPQFAALPIALLALPVLYAPFTAVRSAEWLDNGSLYRASLARNPANRMAAFNIGHFHQYHLDDCETAIGFYEQAVDEVFEAGTNLDVCWIRLGRPLEAARASALFANHHESYGLPAHQASVAHLRIRALETAEAWARETIRRSPNWPPGHLQLSDVLAAQGRGDEAAESQRLAATFSTTFSTPTSSVLVD